MKKKMFPLLGLLLAALIIMPSCSKRFYGVVDTAIYPLKKTVEFVKHLLVSHRELHELRSSHEERLGDKVKDDEEFKDVPELAVNLGDEPNTKSKVEEVDVENDEEFEGFFVDDNKG